MTFNSSFNKRLSVWHLLNLIRIILAGIGLLLVSDLLGEGEGQVTL